MLQEIEKMKGRDFVQRLLDETNGAFNIVEQRVYTGEDTDGFFVSVLKKR